MSTTLTPTTPVRGVGEIDIFRHSARAIHKVVRLNIDGLTHAESLIQPRPAGNCLNWVLGHLVCVYENMLPLFEQQRVFKNGAVKRYVCGSSPIENPAEAMQLSELATAWEQVAERVDAGLAALSARTLELPAPFSPTGDPNETVRSLLTAIFFHQAYHAGQTGILRRIAGKSGAI